MDFQHQEQLEEPYIEIMKVYVRKSSSGEKLYDIVPVLKEISSFSQIQVQQVNPMQN